MTPTLICKTILASSLFFNPIWLDAHPEIKEEATVVCEEVAQKAIDTGIDPVLVTALAYSESRFKRHLRSKAGAIGPLQIMAHHHCPGRRSKGCDLVQTGINTLRKLAIRYGCGKELQKHTEALLNKGGEAYTSWLAKQAICASPDWEKTICHYNSGTTCYSRGFPRLVLSRAKVIQELLEKQ